MLEVVNVSFRADDQLILDNVSFGQAEGEILALIGPSGSGKSTLLRIIAGLERPSVGDVLLNGQSILGVPPHERNFGLMFQDYALFPHLNAGANVAFGLKMRGAPQPTRRDRARELLALVGLPGFEKRNVASLSGGEQQRVALARSLAPNPQLLMLDEPLGALDEALRARLLPELKAIIRRLRLTTIYVTHEQSEAFELADRVAVMHSGCIEQIDRPQTLYRSPRTDFVARFLGLNNILPVSSVDNGHALTAFGTFPVEGTPSALLLPADALRLSPDGAPSMQMVVRDAAFQGETFRLELSHTSGVQLTVTMPSSAEAPPVGSVVSVALDERRVVPLLSADSHGK